MDQRLHERFPIELEARLIDLTGEGKSEGGRLMDVSQGGVCVELTDPVPVGNIVRVDFSEGSLFGQVVHATNEASCFRIGIEVFSVLLGGSDVAQLIKYTLKHSSTVGA